MIWTLRQRRVVVVIVVALLFYLSIRFCIDRKHITDPPPSAGDRAAEVENKIDPNTADEWSLASLPTLGEKRAREIIAYREMKLKLRPGQTVFNELKDLQHVKGIGPGISANVEKYLLFPASPKHN